MCDVRWEDVLGGDSLGRVRTSVGGTRLARRPRFSNSLQGPIGSNGGTGTDHWTAATQRSTRSSSWILAAIVGGLTAAARRRHVEIMADRAFVSPKWCLLSASRGN